MIHGSNVQRQRLKYVATINDEALGEDTDADFEIQYVDIGNVDSGGTIHEIATYRFEDSPSRARRRVRDGDIIISCVRTYLQAIASIQQPPDNLIVSTGFAVVRPRNGVLDVAFAKYALREPAFLAEVEVRSVGVSYPAINASDLADISVCLPPMSRQRAIANYLDRETARLDALVAAKERVLGLLAEKRQALIARAVIRGLDNRAPFRDSGIFWLGEIPVHWSVLPIKYGFARIGSGTTPPTGNTDYYEGDVPWVTTSELRENVVRNTNQCLTRFALERLSALRVYPVGSVLFAMYGATIGRVALLGIEATVNQAVCVLAEPNRLDPAFTFYALQASRDHLIVLASGGGQPNLNAEKVRDHRLPCPSLAEQRAIVAHIERESGKLDALIAATKGTIALLKERRASLIAAAVAGRVSAGEMS